MSNLEIGKKIRNYRIRSGISQFDLEVKIGAASGSLSRIEHGVVNPTKETLLSVIKELKLSLVESANLFGINIVTEDLSTGNKYQDFFEMAKTLLSIKSKDQFLQKSVDLIVEYLDVNAAAIFLVNPEKNGLMPGKVCSNQFVATALKLLPKTFEEYTVSFTDTENYVVKSVLESHMVISKREHDFLRPTVRKSISDAMQLFLRIQEMAAVPLIVNDEVIASIMLSTKKKDYFMKMSEILQTYCEIVSLKLAQFK